MKTGHTPPPGRAPSTLAPFAEPLKADVDHVAEGLLWRPGEPPLDERVLLAFECHLCPETHFSEGVRSSATGMLITTDERTRRGPVHVVGWARIEGPVVLLRRSAKDEQRVQIPTGPAPERKL